MKSISVSLILLLIAMIGAPEIVTAQSGGIQSIDAASFRRQLDAEPQAILLDVRTRSEFEEGHLPGAIHIDVLQADFESGVRELDLTKPIYVYCLAGQRSMRAAQILRSMDATQLYNLRGGIRSWKAHSFPVE